MINKNIHYYNTGMHLIFSILMIFTMRNIFTKLNIDNIVYLLSFVLIIMGFIKGLLKIRIKKWLFPSLIFVFISVTQLIINFYEFGINQSIIGYISIYFYVILWFLFLNGLKHEYISFCFNSFSKWVIIFGIINSLLGVYQYFFDSSIMGLVTHSIYGNEEILSLPNVSRRAIGFLGSPQNYSLYMGISLLLVLRSDYRLKSKIILSSIILFGGILSGSRAFSIFIISLFLVKSYRICIHLEKFKKKFIKYIILLVIAIIPSVFYLLKLDIFNNTTINRLFAFNRWAAMEVFLKSFYNFNFFDFLYGKGLAYGSINFESSKIILDMSSYESYILSLYHRTGIIQVIVFLIIFYTSAKKTYKSGDFVLFSCLIAMFVNICVTPSFAGMQMSFVIWPLILTPLSFEADKIVNIRK